MPKYLFEKYSQAYWEWDEEKMRLYNYHGGWHEVDENSEDWLEGTMIEANDWHDLYLKTRFCPVETDMYERDAWLSPDGKFYEGEGHMVCAEWIVEILYGLKDYDMAEYYLIERGWFKVTTTFMWGLYLADKPYFEMTQAQMDSLYDWCRIHKRQFPEKVFIREVY